MPKELVWQSLGRIKKAFDDVVVDAKNNLKKEGAILSESLMDSLDSKVVYYPPDKKNPFSTMRAYVGVDVKFDKIHKGRYHKPSEYAPIIEYGGQIKLEVINKGKLYTGKRGRAKEIKETTKYITIEPKPFLRPAVVNLDKKIEAIFKKVAEEMKG